MAEKRVYKLQEFAASSSSNVNCLSIGKKSGKLLVSGGEDCKVNLWAIGKTTSLLSLSGHTASVESLTFDSAEVLVLSGASNGAIKLWDLEESKLIRTLTGHRSNVNAVEFHPFGEFFASGSSDTNLKLWDIRKKGCIHTYKGHTQGVSTIRFTPDGRWVVSGGADSVVKVWDLTAGKLLHEFKFHDGPIRCLDFHPLEFLLATGSTDRTVNFWDLETFELIGSVGPESIGVRSMTFHPDGRTLFCGLDDCLKVFSWEPIICHDTIDIGWSTLGDLSIHEGKLLACSYYRNCVGVLAADISFIEPYGVDSSPWTSGVMEHKFNRENHSAQKPESSAKSSIRLSTNPCDYETAEIKNIYVDTTDSRKGALKRVGSVDAPKGGLVLDSSDMCNPSPQKTIPRRETHERTSGQVTSRPFTPPVIVPKSSPNSENTVGSRREFITPARTSPSLLRKSTHVRRPSNTKEARLSSAADSGAMSSKTIGLDSVEEPKFHFKFFSANEPLKPSEENIETVTEKFERVSFPDVPLSFSHGNCAEKQSCSTEISSTKLLNRAAGEQSPSIGTSSVKLVNRALPVQPGRTRSLVERWEKREILTTSEVLTTNRVSDMIPQSETQNPTLNAQAEKGSTGANDEDIIEVLMQSHDLFSSDLRSRLTKLQVVRYFWQRNDVKGGINAVGKLPDHSVQADVVAVLVEKMEIVTLDIFSCLLPLFMGLLNSTIDRHTNVSMEMLLKLAAIFGPVIRSTISASPSVGVDLQAERRREFCNQCFIQLQKIKQLLPSVNRRGGLLSKCAQELNLVLQEL